MSKRAPKIAMIGAGSVVFAKRLLTDLLSWPALQESEIALMDIHQGRLDLIHALGTRLVQQERLPARIGKTTDRREALDGADYVICSIQVGGLERTRRTWRSPGATGSTRRWGTPWARGASSAGCARCPC